MYHIDDRVFIILQISIDRDHRIKLLHRLGKSCPHTTLVTHITRQFDTTHMTILLTHLFDELPGSVLTAIVNEYQTCLHILLTEFYNDFLQTIIGKGEDFLLIVTRHDNSHFGIFPCLTVGLILRIDAIRIVFCHRSN